jgi:CRP-like cAMP-binding protein
MSKNRFIQYLQTNYLDEEAIRTILDKFKTLSLKKGEHILKEGEICTFIAFMESGLVVYYNISESGEEQICDFALENQWISQYKSMITNTGSPISIKTIESTTIHKISYQDLIDIAQQIPSFEKIIKQTIDKLLLQMLDRTNDFQNLRAEERYEKFVNENFELTQRVPQYYLASFLGIAPQSLSRIRKNNSK